MKARVTVQWEIILCIAGLAIFLIPVVPRTGGFWGINRTWTSLHTDRIRIDAVEPTSPASAAGLKPGDYVLEMDNTPVELQAFDERLHKMSPGEEVTLKIEREGQSLNLKGIGEKPRVENSNETRMTHPVHLKPWGFVAAKTWRQLRRVSGQKIYCNKRTF